MNENMDALDALLEDLATDDPLDALLAGPTVSDILDALLEDLAAYSLDALLLSPNDFGKTEGG